MADFRRSIIPLIQLEFAVFHGFAEFLPIVFKIRRNENQILN